MLVRFADPKLECLECDDSAKGYYADAAVRGFRKVMQIIRSAIDERDFRAMRSLRFEALSGDRIGQHSFRLNDQWRLIVTIKKTEPKNVIVVIEIVDYH